MSDLCSPTDKDIALFSLENTKLVCLMPTYNKQDTIAKAIESVMMQKADFAYKLVILDDCSSDDSYVIAQEYKKRYPDKIEIVHNETNLKLLKSITNGYSLLKGVDYFCVLDADDYYIYDKKFADAVAFLESHKDFMSYFANVIVRENDKERLWYDGEMQVLDYNFEDYKRGKAIATQTSGGIFRNVYFKNGMNEAFLQGTKKPYGESIRADGFRVVWHIYAGRTRFVNRPESVYNAMGGIWTSLKAVEQDLLNARLHIAFTDFFPNDKDFFLKQTKNLYDSAVQQLRHGDDDIIHKNKDLIFYIYQNTYLSDNPIFDNKDLENLDKLSITEQIFSIKNTPNKRYKVLTILGITFKFKRKAK